MAGYMDVINGQASPAQPAAPLAQVVNPVQQSTGLDTSKPKSPEDLEARKSGWANLIDSIQNDPTMRNTLMMVGAQLLKGPSFMGENDASIFGRALESGILTHQMGRAGENKMRMEERTAQRQDALTGAQMEASQASAEEKRQRMKIADETLPLTKRQKELQLQQEEFQVQSQPQLLENTLATGKSARELNAAKAERARKGGIGGTGKEREPGIADWYKMANPDATPQEIANMVLTHNKKTEKAGGTDTARLTTLRALFENAESPEQQAFYQNLIHESLGIGQEKAGAGEAEAPAGKFKDPDGFRKKWHAVKEGEVFTYEGKQYRKETPK